MIAYLILIALGASNLFAMDNFLKQVKDSAQNTANTLQTLNETLNEDLASYRAAKEAAIETAKAAVGWLAWMRGVFTFRRQVVKSIKLPETNPAVLKAVLHNHSVIFNQNWVTSNALEEVGVDYSANSVQDFINRKTEAERTNQQESITQIRTKLAQLKQAKDQLDGELRFKQLDVKKNLNSTETLNLMLTAQKCMLIKKNITIEPETIYEDQVEIANLTKEAAELLQKVQELESKINNLNHEIVTLEASLDYLLKNQKPLPNDPLLLYDYNNQSVISLSELLHSNHYDFKTLSVNQYLVDNYSCLVRCGVFYNNTNLEEIYKALCELYPGVIAQVNNNFGPINKIAVALADIFSYKKICVVPFKIQEGLKFEKIACFELELVEQVAHTIMTNKQNQDIVATKNSIEQLVKSFCVKAFDTQDDEIWDNE